MIIILLSFWIRWRINIDFSVEGLKSALLMAVDDWRKMSIDLVERELFVRRLIKDALN